MTRQRSKAMQYLLDRACGGDKKALEALAAISRATKRDDHVLDNEPVILPLREEYFEFAYSDDGTNDPLTVLLEREENDEFTLESITVRTHTTINITYKG